MSRRERQRRAGRRGARARPFFLAAGMLAVVAVIAVGAAVGYVLHLANSGPSLDELHPIPQGQNSIVYAADGTRLGYISSPNLRSRIDGKRIPQVMRDATVAIEDKRFFDHSGVDYIGIVRAAVKDVRSHSALQGGSTLTMQLIKNLYPGTSVHRDFQTKVREAKLAEEMEKKHPGRTGKEWILTSYLNNVPVRHGGRQGGHRRPGGGAHLLRHDRLEADAAPGRAPWPACPRRRRTTTRSTPPRPRSSAATRC